MKLGGRVGDVRGEETVLVLPLSHRWERCNYPFSGLASNLGLVCKERLLVAGDDRYLGDPEDLGDQLGQELGEEGAELVGMDTAVSREIAEIAVEAFRPHALLDELALDEHDCDLAHPSIRHLAGEKFESDLRPAGRTDVVSVVPLGVGENEPWSLLYPTLPTRP